jgi:hypothetical protein
MGVFYGNEGNGEPGGLERAPNREDVPVAVTVAVTQPSECDGPP